MRVGVHTEPISEPEFPLSTVRRTFVGPGPIPAQDLVPRLSAALAGHGDMVVWSFKPSRVNDGGAWKPYVLKLAQYIKDNGLQERVVIVVWHEPENDFTNPADFVGWFNTVHDWMMSVDPTIRTCHAALGYAYAKIDVATARKWVTKASINAIDLYSGNSFPLDMTLGTSTAFKVWKASRPDGKPWAVTERGWFAKPSWSAVRVASINAEADWLASLPAAGRPAFYIVWDTAGQEANHDLVLDQSGADAVNAMFARLATPVCPLCHGTGSVAPGDYVIVRARL